MCLCIKERINQKEQLFSIENANINSEIMAIYEKSSQNLVEVVFDRLSYGQDEQTNFDVAA